MKTLIVGLTALALSGGTPARADQWVPLKNNVGIVQWSVSTAKPMVDGNGWHMVWARVPTLDGSMINFIFGTNCNGLYAAAGTDKVWRPTQMVPPDSIAAQTAEIACR